MSSFGFLRLTEAWGYFLSSSPLVLSFNGHAESL
ncbi:hypothetical protein SAMN05421862_103267 [Pseudomonas extremaustralis]|nr:hypothetical protein SAMN05421862_103267 [Pseudomonas extremaustralis]